MRRVGLLLVMMVVALVVGSGVALAVNKIGTNGPDTLRGTNRADNLLGKGGNDILYGLGGRDNLLGQAGKDVVIGGKEFTYLGGDKNLAGGSNNDVVIGGRGSDNILGQEGNDLLVGGPFTEPSEDNVSGGSGNDVLDTINRPPFGDTVVCGRGFDRVLADRKDEVAPDCEKVAVGLAAVQQLGDSLVLTGLSPRFIGF